LNFMSGCGSQGVKSSLLLRFLTTSIPRIILERFVFGIHEGQERFRTITSIYFCGTHGVVFSNAKRWLHEIDADCESAQKIFVGNKNEDSLRRVALKSVARQFTDMVTEEMFSCITGLVQRVGANHLRLLLQTL
uniref:PUM-HD domain-containing protein n=1 Tax=Angiostrongylus cantonensis TaxID=6313 RepID=A0A0K0CVX4_ANGCA